MQCLIRNRDFSYSLNYCIIREVSNRIKLGVNMRLLFRSIVLVCFMLNFSQAQDRPDPNVPQGINFEVPEGWEVRLDHEMEEVVIGSKIDSSDIYFVNMTPGWHIKTGPAGIFYHPANTASGTFGIKTELHFF